MPNDAWYAEAVYAANDAGYIGGIGGSTLFAPLSNITRADVACVLYRMAGGSIDASEEGMTNSELGYISQFEDVDPNAYYAKAVAWTTKVGITNGYGTTFGSDRAITTEEFATMLARYAKVTGTDTSVDADAVLAKVADGDKVTGYARESVAWAVEQGIPRQGRQPDRPAGHDLPRPRGADRRGLPADEARRRHHRPEPRPRRRRRGRRDRLVGSCRGPRPAAPPPPGCPPGGRGACRCPLTRAVTDRPLSIASCRARGRSGEGGGPSPGLATGRGRGRKTSEKKILKRAPGFSSRGAPL